MTIELTPEQTQQLKLAISDTAEQGRALIQNSNNNYAGIVNAQWRGTASAAGMNKQNELMGIWTGQLQPILAQLQHNIAATENMIGAADDEASQAHNVVNADGGGAMPNFARLA
ncbi:hypothetical protein [Qaidamihabitans albus]|uniref:hypothetical protein n=1 Tax=Qaidamihabitans albus TaxID=2795733 RepID=UPI0018F26B38|nr:hypothetical protein [Qaidamihabitans albus]